MITHEDLIRIGLKKLKDNTPTEGITQYGLFNWYHIYVDNGTHFQITDRGGWTTYVDWTEVHHFSSLITLIKNMLRDTKAPRMERLKRKLNSDERWFQYLADQVEAVEDFLREAKKERGGNQLAPIGWDILDSL